MLHQYFLVKRKSFRGKLTSNNCLLHREYQKRNDLCFKVNKLDAYPNSVKLHNLLAAREGRRFFNTTGFNLAFIN